MRDTSNLFKLSSLPLFSLISSVLSFKFIPTLFNNNVSFLSIFPLLSLPLLLQDDCSYSPLYHSTQRFTFQASPLNKFIMIVSAVSSALWPVSIYLQFNFNAALSMACLRNTPHYPQLFLSPITPTISSIVYPYKSLYVLISNGIF